MLPTTTRTDNAPAGGARRRAAPAGMADRSIREAAPSRLAWRHDGGPGFFGQIEDRGPHQIGGLAHATCLEVYFVRPTAKPAETPQPAGSRQERRVAQRQGNTPFVAPAIDRPSADYIRPRDFETYSCIRKSGFVDGQHGIFQRAVPQCAPRSESHAGGYNERKQLQTKHDQLFRDFGIRWRWYIERKQGNRSKRESRQQIECSSRNVEPAPDLEYQRQRYVSRRYDRLPKGRHAWNLDRVSMPRHIPSDRRK